MRLLHVKIDFLPLALSGVILLSACAGVSLHEEIAQSEGLMLEEKIQELVYRGASRTEVVATFGEATGYTDDALSYTVYAESARDPDMVYDDPGHPGYYRWVLAFDDRGTLYNYRRIPIDSTEEARHLEARNLRYGNVAVLGWDVSYRTGFTALECTDTEHCWAVGGAGIVLETTNGGKSWVSHVSGTYQHRRNRHVVPSVYSAAFPDRVNGWLAGHESALFVGGLILHSSDRGTSWMLQLKSSSGWGPRPALWSITFSDNHQGWAVGGKGTILHTSDGGSTWEAQSSGTEAALLSVGFCSGQSGWAVGSSWTILHTSDAGQSWRSQAIRADQLRSKTPERKLFPWAMFLSMYPYENPLTSVSVIDCRQGWIAGDHGTILHTEDGGASWHAQPSGTAERLNAVQFISIHQGWAVGDRGVILKTVNGGKEWIPQSSGTREDLRDLSFVDADHGWIGGSYGTILHTTDGGITWTKQCLVYDCAGEAAQQFYAHPWLTN